jgi:hypothetical protein
VDGAGEGGVMAEGRCPVCKQYQHVTPGSMTEVQIYRHRIREKRDCPGYEECLTEAAIEDAVMVPCVGCRKFKK